MPVNTYSLDLESGSSQFASISDASQTGLDITGDLTMECWVNPESSVSDVAILSKCNTSQQGGIYFAYRSTQRLRVVIDQTTNTTTISEKETTNTLSNGSWQHVAFNYTASTGVIQVFIDGSEASYDGAVTKSNATSINNNANAFVIGGLDTGAEYYDGLVDEVRVYNAVLSGSTISANKDDHIDPNTANLQGYWRLNNDYTDQTSNGNNLTASGSPIFSTSVPFAGTSDSMGTLFFNQPGLGVG